MKTTAAECYLARATTGPVLVLTMSLTLSLCSGIALAQATQPSVPENNFQQQAHHTVDPELRALLRDSISEADSFQDRFDAEVWLLQKSGQLEKFVKDPAKRLHLLRHVHREASRAGVPPEFVLAVIEVESHFDRYAVSSAGAQGLMQIMPFWKNEIGREDDNLIDLETNLRYGCTILKYYYDKAQGDWAEALARYNGSFGYYWNYSEKVMVAWQENWR